MSNRNRKKIDDGWQIKYASFEFLRECYFGF